jgi:capreomycidine synthase
MQITRAYLEDWMRQYYFNSEIDIGSSGVENFSMSELRQLLDLKQEELDEVVFNDSPSCGVQGLREAIARQWGDGNPEKVLATHGSSEVIFLIMNSLLSEGDEVIVLDPCYHALRNLATAQKCKVVDWHLRFEQKFAPDLDEFKSLITPQTRMVVANFPHNPTGASITAAQQQELIERVADVGAYLVWDGAFNELVYDSQPLPEPSTLYHRAITLGTLSKGYGLAGLRAGWCFAAPELLERFIHWRDYTTLYLSPLIEVVAQRAVEQADKLLDIRLKRARQNLDLLAGWIEEHSEFVEWVRPQGGVTAFVRLKGVPDVEDFCHRLGREHGVMIVPGSCFEHPSYARIGFGGPTSELVEGLARVSHLLKNDAIRQSEYIRQSPHKLVAQNV